MTVEQIGLIFGFIILPLLCIGIERAWPQVKSYTTFRPAFTADALWYFFQSFVSRFVAPWIVFFALLPVFYLVGHSVGNYWAGFGPVSRLPFWLQMALVFVLGDFLSYWQHRLFHRPALWPIHSVHHSSEKLDWLSTTRFHPLNEIGSQLIYVAPLLAIGISPVAFLWFAPFTATVAVLLHLNTNISFGPLKYWIASPVFHRWHHATNQEAQGKNYSGFLPIWDVIFGTFYHPKDQVPQSFGIDEAMPEGFLAQLVYPFKHLNKQGAAVDDESKR